MTSTTITTTQATTSRPVFTTQYEDYYNRAQRLLAQGMTGYEIQSILGKATDIAKNLDIQLSFCTSSDHSTLKLWIDETLHFFGKDIVVMTELSVALNALIWRLHEENRGKDENFCYTQWQKLEEHIFNTFEDSTCYENTPELTYFLRMTD